MTRFMWCSTRSTVSSKSSRILRMNSPRSATSSWFSPPAGSSSRRRRGFATRARASSTRFWIPYGSAAAGKSARSRRPTTSRTSRASFSPALRPRPCAPIRTLSSTDIVRKSWMFWNVLATPLRTILNAGCLRSDDPSSRTSPVSGLYRRVMTLNAVVLPAPFGTDEARDVALLDVERDAVESDDSAEAQGDVPYLEEGHPQQTLNRPDARWQRGAPRSTTRSAAA